MHRLNLRGRILLGFIAVLMLPLGSAVWAIRGALEVQKHTRGLAEMHYPVLDAASRTATRLTTFQATASSACSSFDASALEHARGMAQELDSDIQHLGQLAGDSAIEELRGAARKYAADTLQHCAAMLGGHVSEKMRDEIVTEEEPRRASESRR